MNNKKPKSIICWYGDILLAKIKNQSSRNILLTQNLVQKKALILFHSVKAEGGEETAEEKSEANRGWFRRFKERSISIT